MNIAIVGSGISGLGASLLLSQKHNVTLFEEENYLGGHTRTVDVGFQGTSVAVDTGFIVYNEVNYPNLTGMFRYLGVDTQESGMSFGVSVDRGFLEYGTDGLGALFSQPSNLFRWQFWGLLKDLLRFNRNALSVLDDPRDLSLGDWLEEMKLGYWFKRYYILPMGGAIWSSPLEQMLEFPAKTFIQFFKNHGLIALTGQPKWRTVRGGARNYVSKIAEMFSGTIVHNGVRAAWRTETGVKLELSSGEQREFDAVVFACHADQVVSVLKTVTKKELEILSSFQYQDNDVILHGDTSFMPKSRRAWASWVYLLEAKEDVRPRISVSYWMNNLQHLPPDKPLIVTLNPSREPQADLVYNRHVFSHPIFDARAVQAQQEISSIQGKDRIWYCGAYQRFGFHEDGLWSAVRVAEQLGVTVPW